MILDTQTSKGTQPINPNFLNPNNFRFTLHRAPVLNFFVIDASLPNVDLSAIYQHTPFIALPKPGTKLTYGKFNMTFKVDEDFVNYAEIYDWMSHLGLGEGFSDYKNYIDKYNSTSGKGQFSDCTLTKLNSSKKPNIEITLRDAFPTNLGSIEFAVDSSDVKYASCRVEFTIRDFVVTKL